MLKRIAEAKIGEVNELRTSIDLDKVRPRITKGDPLAVFKGNQPFVKVIAEIKKASPSKGVLCEDFNPRNLAAEYAGNGAAVISVITDRQFFQGCGEYLAAVKEEVKLPVLRKDFIIDEIQLYESLQLGADLVLLIAALHDYKSLLALSEKSRELGMEALLEVHDKQELKTALDLPVRMIGVNNRNLKDFTVDIKTSLKLAEIIPDSFIKISESGIKSAEDMILLEKQGFNGALVGEALVSSPNPGARLRELIFYRELMNGDQS
ncbi:MAG: indole-3-glycerol phosphate synthase TrpC [Syntrophomonadaceae bacterium]|nr:indole-3-glycerol phosphate synthase TrpC [Syntrophomonadaceae bacterium]MDD3023657.1 indole-3-glycerol phosphate synthase TrpC [Syntrophomonadaceae bacterium]